MKMDQKHGTYITGIGDIVLVSTGVNSNSLGIIPEYSSLWLVGVQD